MIPWSITIVIITDPIFYLITEAAGTNMGLYGMVHVRVWKVASEILREVGNALVKVPEMISGMGIILGDGVVYFTGMPLRLARAVARVFQETAPDVPPEASNDHPPPYEVCCNSHILLKLIADYVLGFSSSQLSR